ncbi:MAG: hypothetical protein IT536_15105 [Hyphomicrobiales bacterium]|nr:hypothetical protein [Hyphomicrobiales bacterium]
MGRNSLDTALAQTIAWLWLGFLAAGVVAWFAYRYWRKRRPPPLREPKRSYSQRLEQRLAKSPNTAKRKRRGGSAKSHPRRHG